MITRIIDYVADFGVELIKDKINNEREKKEIRDRLAKYIKREQSINFDCTPEEEIDFGGLIQYIQTNFLDDVQLRIFGNKEERDRAREDIKAKAIINAKANNSLSQERAIKMIETAVDILYNFYNSAQNKDLRLMAAQIENTVIDQADEIKEIIKEGISTSIDKNVSLMKKGEISEVEDKVKTMLNTLGCTHNLYPDYQLVYDSEKNIFYSKPLSKEALEKYPPRISCTGTVEMNGKNIDTIDVETINYANRHQYPLKLNVVTAKKMLGDIVDPVQHEAEELMGTSIIIPPKPFPKAFPCSISINDAVMFDYILFRIEEILDDETIIMTNREQENCPFKMNLSINVKLQCMDLSIQKNNNITNEETLHYLKFLLRGKTGGIISIKILSLRKELGSGKLDCLNYDTGFGSVENEVAFYEKIVAIEHHFYRTISVPKEIEYCDFKMISYLYALINGDECKDECASFSIQLPVTEQLRQIILESNNKKSSLSYVGTIYVPIFNEMYEIAIIKTFESVVYDNLEKLKKLVELLDIGDEIKLKFLPYDGDKIVWSDCIKPDDMDKQ